MSNLASVLKEVITRLARKEIKAETEVLNKASSQYRTEISALKKRLAVLEKMVARLTKASAARKETKATPEKATRIRFSAKGLSTKRQKLGLSAADMGALLGVSAQTIYNWEAEKARPRQKQLDAFALIRAMGKRQAVAKLKEMAE